MSLKKKGKTKQTGEKRKQDERKARREASKHNNNTREERMMNRARKKRRRSMLALHVLVISIVDFLLKSHQYEPKCKTKLHVWVSINYESN
jgi:hypothetical protein